jgi:hypothetical protein
MMAVERFLDRRPVEQHRKLVTAVAGHLLARTPAHP